MPLVMVQRLVGQQEAVVQHVELAEEVRVDLHLPQQPGPLLVCTGEEKDAVRTGGWSPAELLHRGAEETQILTQSDDLAFKVEVFENHDDVTSLRCRLRPATHLTALDVIPATQNTACSHSRSHRTIR